MYSFITCPISSPIYDFLPISVVLHCFYIKIFILLKLRDIKSNPGPRKSSACKFCHWNLNVLAVHEFIKVCLLEGYKNADDDIDIVCPSETFSDSSIPIDDNRYLVQSQYYFSLLVSNPLFPLFHGSFLITCLKSINLVSLGKGNLTFCYTGSQENFTGLVTGQNNNIHPKFQGRHIKKLKY